MNKTSKRIRKKHYKKRRTYKKNKTIKKKTNKNLYKKRRRYLLSLPGSKGLSLFTRPEKISSQSILVNQYKQSGNMIPGLRNM
jgi:hypothetical protein